jgi:1,4-alpha-glucan branching enzyme
MLTKEAQTAQVKIGVELFNDVFGFRPAGIWLPECAYSPGIEKILGEEGIKYFVVSSHGMLNASPQVSSAVYAPVNVGNNVAAFGRDLETSHQVWSRTEGYPGDYAYREFYRDIGYDLDYDYIASYLVAGIRGDTGLKYYRITGKDDRKEPYDYHQARAKAREHAENFVFNRNIQVMHWKKQIKQKPIVVAPYDAELFGHWWFEGPDWLEEVCRLTAKSDNPTRLTTFSAYLREFPPQQEVRMTYSTWGDGGFNRVWLNESNDWIYPHLHRAEKAMVTMADNYCQPSQLQIKALNQAVRELLLAQSSDWPFIINGNTTVDYAKRRFHEHLDNFFNICHQFQNNLLDDHFLTELENVHPIFPKVDYRVYQSINNRLMQLSSFMSFHKPVVLMLSWEYPPNHVGGLGIHVRNLSEVLAKEFSVHVLTFT